MSQSARFIEYLLKKLKFNKMLKDLENTEDDSTLFTEIVHASRKKDNRSKPSEKLYKKYDISEISINNHAAYFLKHKSGANEKVLFFLHGGAYVKGPLALQWKAMTEIADASGYDLAVMDYPKAPEFSGQDAIDYCTLAYDEILKFYTHNNIVFIGDSAGGGLALSFSMLLRDLGRNLPSKMILLSPWLDISMSNKEMDEYKDKDLILTIKGLISCGLHYADGMDVRDWRVSPLYGEVDKLPEAHICVGGHFPSFNYQELETRFDLKDK